MQDQPAISLTEADREALRAWAAGRPEREVRARIVRDAADGVSVSDSARALRVSRPTVSSWRRRYAENGLAGLAHRPRSGRPPRIDEADVVAATLAGPPAPRRAWSARALADHLGISHTALGAVWRRWGVDGESHTPLTLPTNPPLTCRRPLLLGLWSHGRAVALVIAEAPTGPQWTGQAAPAAERRALGAALRAALPSPRESAGDTVTAEGRAELTALLRALASTPRLGGPPRVLLWDPAGEIDPGPPSDEESWHRAPDSMGWQATLGVLCSLELLDSPLTARPVLDSLLAALRGGAARSETAERGTRWRRPDDAPVPGPPPRAPRAFDQLALGSFNEKLVIETIREAGALSRVEIAARTGLTPQAVSRITRNLLTSAFLVEDTHRQVGKGKPRVPLRLRADASHAVGIHLDPEMVTQVVVDLCGGVVARRQVSLRERSDPEWVMGLVARMVAEATEAAGAALPLGVGIAVPGPLDAEAGVVRNPPLFEGWQDVPLREELSRRLALPVLMEKDVTAAAIGERWLGAAERAGDFVYLYLGTGAGCGAFLNGDVYRGRTGNAGEFGALCALGVGHRVEGGGPGTVEECAPIPAVVRRAAAAGLVTEEDPGAYERVCRAAFAGDPEAVSLLRSVAHVVARGAVGVTDLLDTTLLIVGGPAVRPEIAGIYLAEIDDAVSRFAAARAVRRVRVAPSLLNESAAAVGAASSVFHAAFAPRLRTHPADDFPDTAQFVK
ncbi:Sugar kinase of the NBD/HSP70 family, may contain an N-terminal HTH domain [Streptomyces zhaozhouensis]|uniref:Sugar kinase of the NBD/HSP70 family, may contain an N-terminal HTH domain n=1 Tax=Streptomyces zhaozhouensis TaxID=1300267 RepID=A0A286DPD7_9ACTN|nr:ROK family protein [Streptomyces zhaozhouensis]SOD60509.1 Sugar kinase of the NBD/HSP70 family, may contain an N-terminal HTH domain [Streptomyces zhaozhouensis]